MKKTIYSNNLFISIISTVVMGVVCLVIAIGTITITSSKETFLEVFSESQKKIFDQIDSEFYLFYRDMAEITEQVSESAYVKNYLSGEFENQLEERNCILELKRVIDNSVFGNYLDCSILLAGKTGRTYMYKGSEMLIMSTDEIMQSGISLDAMEQAQSMVVSSMENGFTTMTAHTPVIVFARAIGDEGVVYVTIHEEKFREMYSYFTSNTSDIIIFNQSGKIISSNKSVFSSEESEEITKVLKEMEEKKVSHLTVKKGLDIKLYQIQRFQNTGYKILGIINPNKAFEEKYNIRIILLMTVVITLAVASVLWRVVRRLTRPLYQLVDTMARVGEDNLEVYAQETGTPEIRQLSHTYNNMMQEINSYIQKILYVEEEKRKAEIHALQMQINPHYIYNTLASIKFLVWQNDMEKATKMIDAFVSLLRNTISDKNKFVTVEQDIRNLQNYVFINQVRYGEHIKVEYFVAPDCRLCMIPKLILQPFVENAFFHAFPENQNGYIHVFVRKENSHLKIDIKDNGVGIEREKVLAFKNNKELKREHFNGIGINNVDDRIKLIYGEKYGIDMESEEGKGTAITILFPLDEV
uniref:cache domain-containing sensor histidine kinase n=1 Tax=Agathobacter sp. TaxID=2021311 RepID=UPI0040560F37